MDAQQLALLPPWLQVALSILAFAAAAWVYFTGLFKKLPVPPAANAPKDVIIPSLTIADSKIIEAWIVELRTGNLQDKDRADLVRRALFILEQMNDRIGSIEHELKRRGG